MGMGFAPT